MKISIITISYNQIKYLKECIESVLSQSYTNIEYIIVDPGSTDGSRELIEAYGNRITNVIFEPDRGPADGLNKGFKCATGEILYYLNSDDVLMPDSLSKVIKYFQSNPRCDVLIGDAIQIDQNGKTIKPLFSSKIWTPYRYGLGIARAVQQSTFFRAECFLDVGGFNINNNTCWDGELLVDMALAGAKVHTTNEIYGCFRIYPDSISGSGRLNKVYQIDQARIQNKIFETTGKKGSQIVKGCLKFYDLLRNPINSINRLKNRLK